MSERVERALHRVSAGVTRRLVVRRHLASITGLGHIPADGPVVVVSNHSSFFDHFLLETAVHAVRGRRTYFLTKQESFRGARGVWHRSVGAVPVDRSGPKPSTLRQIDGLLDGGNVLVVYPEGTRGPGWPLLPFKSGAVQIALRGGAPVVPVGIAGAAEILPRGSRVPRPARARMAIGAPLPTHADLPRGARVQRVTADAERAVAALVAQASATTQEDARRAAQALAATVGHGVDRLHDDATVEPEELRRLQVLGDLAAVDDADNHDVAVQRLRVLGLRALAASTPRRLWLARPIRRKAAEVVAADPANSLARYVLGRWHLAMPALLGGDPVVALDQLQEAVRQEPEDARFRLALGEALARAGRHADAASVLRPVLEGPVRTPRERRRADRARVLHAALPAASPHEQRQLHGLVAS